MSARRRAVKRVDGRNVSGRDGRAHPSIAMEPMCRLPSRCARSCPGQRAGPTKSRRPAFAGPLVDVVRKPSSVPPRGRPRCGGVHSSRTAVTGRLEQPTRGLERAALHSASCEEAARPPMWPCSRWGLPCRLRYRRRGGLLPRRFTLTCRTLLPKSSQAVSSLLHFPSRSRDRALPGIVLCGARTFLPPRFWPFRTWSTTGDRLFGIDGAQGDTASLAPQWGRCVS